MFSKRTTWNFSENKLSLLLKSLKPQGEFVIDLSESNPTHCNFKYLSELDLLGPLTHPANLDYQPSPNGKKEARQTIQAYYRKKGVEVDSERIFLTASTSEAYTYIFRLLSDPKDRVMIPRPSYPLFNFIADLNDIALDPYSIRYEQNQWRIHSDELTSSIHPNTKALILVHPNNPTGSFLKINEASELIRIAQLKSLALISDEVFSDYGFQNDSQRKISFSETQEVLTFTLGGISKSLGLPQMKLSWMVLSGPEKIVSQALARLEIIADTYLSVNTPAQEALRNWFSHQNQIQNEIKERIRSNQFWLKKQLPGSSVSCLNSEGGWYTILKLPDVKTEEEWILEFLEQDRVLVHPGYFFDFEEEAYIVLSLLPECAQFQEGCNRILSRIKSTSSL